MPSPNIVYFWVSVFGGGIVGGIVSASLTYCYNRRLAAENRKALKNLSQDERKRNFRGFMSEFRSWAERTPFQIAGDQFSERVHAFRNEAARIREDVPDPIYFDEIALALCRLTASQVGHYIRHDDGSVTYEGRNRICAAIDKIVDSLN